jgi:hypothetical protein
MEKSLVRTASRKSPQLRKRFLFAAAAQLQKFLLIQNPDAQFLRLVQLGAGFGAGQNEIRFLAHAARSFTANPNHPSHRKTDRIAHHRPFHSNQWNKA